MATGSSTTIPFMPTFLGPAAAPTILTGSSAAAGPVTSFDLANNQKRWVVIGITLNRLLLPVLRDFAGREITKHYASLKTSSGIDTQVYPTYMKKDGPFDLNYGSINNNWVRFQEKGTPYMITELQQQSTWLNFT
ncbi:hypothetical protein OS493_021344 [Desmophyllum pertusum]|uniref:Uncharacterized protein n=1 Tax=Desmophyllum pertusum TaxID=174260 RepID=A0A9W9ZDN5_9CNID|nr:hypothetical protein OS493_021344 [Desmophyllum pertusum]